MPQFDREKVYAAAAAHHRPDWWPEDEPWPPRRRHRPPWRYLLIPLAAIVLFGLLSAIIGALIAPWHHEGPPWQARFFFFVLLASIAVFLVRRGQRRFGQPVAEIIEATGRLAEGDYSVRVEPRGWGGLHVVMRSFNAMAERLAQGEEQRRNLVADVAHEVRTPLAVIRGNVEGMIDGVYPLDTPHLEPILDEVRVISRLVDDLQTLSSAEAGVLRLHREPTDLALLSEEVAAMLLPQAEARHVLLRVDAAEMALMEVDPVRVREVLVNLVANSLRHTPAGGAITITVRPAGSGVQLVVSDTGTGISVEELPHVFDRYRKSADSNGSGLGLAIARGLVRAHGGEIRAESEAGKGTRMEITLPMG